MMTQEELALKAGVGVRTIRDIESGKVRPQSKTLRLLVEALNLDERGRAVLAGRSGSLAAVPRELPRPPAGFVGREEHLDAIVSAVGDGAAIVAVHGMAGVGKTSLAVRAAHALAPRYPDGQLFVDLHGFTNSAGSRPDAASVLTRVLDRLGVDERYLPTDLGELAACYRSTIANLRVLLVFENATDVEQLESLMPGTTTSLVLTTSRRDLSRLTSAYAVLLEPPSMREAVEMLGTAVSRITDDGAVAIAERCGRLPLALGLAAARLRSRPQWRAEDLLARLDHKNRLLDELDMGHGGVTAALRASYLELDPNHQRLLRRLSLVPGDDVETHAAAALCDTDQEDAAAMLESLVDVHLAESRSPGRYRLHDLVRLFATRLAELEEAQEDLDGAFIRLLGVYLHFSYQAAIQVPSQHQRMLKNEATRHDIGLPGFTDQESAVAWFQAERGNLAAAVLEAERAGHLESAWHLANAFSAFRMHERGIEQHLAVNRTALDIARRLDDERKEAHSLGDQGRHLMYASRHREAISCLERVAALNRKLGDNGGAALALRSIGIQHEQSGRFTEALDVYRAALALAETDAGTRAIVHINVNIIFPLLRLGRLADAERRLDAAEQHLEAEDGYNRIRIEFYRGAFVREHGDPATALVMHTACLEQCREAGLLGGFTAALIELGEDLLLLDRPAEAVTCFSQAVEQAEEMAYLAFERIARNGLGRALTATGSTGDAIDHHARAAALAETHEDVYELARARHGLAAAHRRRGEMSAAVRHLRRAVQGFEDCEVPEAAAAAAELVGLQYLRVWIRIRGRPGPVRGCR
ncbi:NB-ARC domain-containing protein [Glycomyces harbinensis]|uniref:NB-ARC domain-containing protein n=2 Tax=Glycomyces harbinensis TaxID=58114 RepID=A0A1G6XHM2_9ACTN|nr:NB-ARC domain-containing protein [Glycomyces harbinensis]